MAVVNAGGMHVITRKRLVDFWKDYPEAEAPLRIWLKIMERKRYTEPSELKADFASASLFGAGCTVFNIGGNKYRLVVTVRYDMGPPSVRCRLFPPVMPHLPQRYIEDTDFGGNPTGATAWSQMEVAVQFPKQPGGTWVYIDRNLPDKTAREALVFPVHAIQLPTKKILLMGGSGNVPYTESGKYDPNKMGIGLFDPDTDTVSANVPLPRITDKSCHSVNIGDYQDVFCCGHNVLPDGRVFVIGGTELYRVDPASQVGHHRHFPGLKNCAIYNPTSNVWERASCMAHGRWYPGSVVMSDGRVFVMAGHTDNEDDERHENTDREIYDPKSNTWARAERGNPLTGTSGDPGYIGTYPRLHLLPDGSIFDATVHVIAGSSPQSVQSERWVPSGYWIRVNDGRGGIPHHAYPSALLPLLPGKYGDPQILAFNDGTDAYVCRPLASTESDRQWISTGRALGRPATSPTPPRRFYGNATILPDATVLVSTGTNTTEQGSDAAGVLDLEFYDHFSNSSPRWRLDTIGLRCPRNYHSNAILLYDGRVLICGSNANAASGFESRDLSFEIYSPEYLRRGPRPQFTLNKTQLAYGEELQLTLQGDWKWQHLNPDRIGLMRCSSTTHAFSYDQRYVGLKGQSNSNTGEMPGLNDAQFRVRIPARSETPSGPDLLPPGPYMLFLLSAVGAPSLASIIFIQ